MNTASRLVAASLAPMLAAMVIPGSAFAQADAPSRADRIAPRPAVTVSAMNVSAEAATGEPVSSSNSRRATASSSSSASTSPFGMDQAPLSFLRQNGPPG